MVVDNEKYEGCKGFQLGKVGYREGEGEPRISQRVPPLIMAEPSVTLGAISSNSEDAEVGFAIERICVANKLESTGFWNLPRPGLAHL